jgi:hypothetical protein
MARLRMLVRTASRDSIGKSTKIAQKRGTTLSQNHRPASNKINDLSYVDPREL